MTLAERRTTVTLLTGQAQPQHVSQRDLLIAHLTVQGWFPVEDGIACHDRYVWVDPMGNLLAASGASFGPESNVWPKMSVLARCARHEGMWE